MGRATLRCWTRGWILFKKINHVPVSTLSLSTNMSKDKTITQLNLNVVFIILVPMIYALQRKTKKSLLL